jgi:hypothetical protein
MPKDVSNNIYSGPAVHIIDKFVNMNCFPRPAWSHSVLCIANYRSKSFGAPCSTVNLNKFFPSLEYDIGADMLSTVDTMHSRARWKSSILIFIAIGAQILLLHF